MTTVTARSAHVLGDRIPNVEWEDKTSGSASYAGDVRLPGMLFASICRSPYPHARILSIDDSTVHRVPGVVATLTAADLPDRKYIHHGGPMSDRRVLAVDVVRHVGEEVAAVAAETITQARAAARRFDIRYRRLRAATTMAQATKPRAPRIHGHVQGNIALSIAHAFGTRAAGKPGDVSMAADYSFPQQNHACMETNTIVASWNPPSQQLEVWVSTQAPYFVRKELAHVLDLDLDQVLVRQVAVGGGFGSKSKISEYEAIAAALSIKTGRPVGLSLTRDEEFSTTKSRHRFEISLTTEATASGTLASRRAVINVENGSYNHSGPSVMGAGTGAIASLYRVPHVEFAANLVYTNKHPGGQFRGYGNPQVTFAIESQMDELADRLGIDPIELRIRNANRSGDVTHAGYRLGSAGLVQCLEAARDEIGWLEKRPLGGTGRGVGIGAAIQVSGAYVYPGANRSSATVEIGLDGQIIVRFGGADAGTGQRTVLAQIVASELSVPVTRVRVLMMDSQQAPTDLGAWSSRGTFMGGHAVRLAARSAASELRLRTAALAGIASEEVDLGDGHVHGAGRSWTIEELMTLTGADQGPVEVTQEYVADIEEPDFRTGRGNISGAYSFAAHAVEVEVDRRTGQVRVCDVVAAHDSGSILNPLLAESQVMGGVVMGLGAALGEELVYEGGHMVNQAYVNYSLPRAADMPPIRPVFVGADDPNGPYGAKGIGEIAMVPTAAAVANAVAHAVGVRIRGVPLTPDKVLTALRAAGEAPSRRRYHIWRRPSRWQVAAMRRMYPLGIHAVLHRFGTRFAQTRDVPDASIIRTPSDVTSASEDLRRAGAFALSGGTDLLPAIQQGLKTPSTLIDVTVLPGLGQTRTEPDGTLRIGAAVRLAELEQEGDDTTPSGVIGQAVRTIASPQIRQMATVAGNLCQQNRCWFYRSGFTCYKRGGVTCPCYAIGGDHRFYHAAMGAHRCQAVTPSDLATVFAAIDATALVASGRVSRRVPVLDLYRGPGETVLKRGEFLTAIEIPGSAAERSSAFEKLNLWTGDFAIVSACSSLKVDAGRVVDARVAVGALAPTPTRLPIVERAIVGTRPADHHELAEIANAWTGRAHPLANNSWKIEAAAGLVLNTLERCLGWASG